MVTTETKPEAIRVLPVRAVSRAAPRVMECLCREKAIPRGAQGLAEKWGRSVLLAGAALSNYVLMLNL